MGLVKRLPMWLKRMGPATAPPKAKAKRSKDCWPRTDMVTVSFSSVGSVVSHSSVPLSIPATWSKRTAEASNKARSRRKALGLPSTAAQTNSKAEEATLSSSSNWSSVRRRIKADAIATYSCRALFFSCFLPANKRGHSKTKSAAQFKTWDNSSSFSLIEALSIWATEGTVWVITVANADRRFSSG